MDLFVYGTLLDAETMERLTGQRFACEAAVLDDFERVAPPADYPFLRPRPGASVEGLMWLDVDAASLARLDEYEEEGRLYRRVEVTVRPTGRDGQVRRCFTYVGIPRPIA